MSDGSDFDKEAERERLREKYERDEKKRESTQRMSELLLKGATMTNRHCDDCGDPVFRYDGQEFCPSCETPVEGGGGTTPADEAAGAQAGGTPAADASGGADQPRTADARTGTDADDAHASAATDAAVPDAGGAAGSSPRPDAATPASADRAGDTQPDGDVAAARSALARSIQRLADRAAATDDPRRARESLEAAREAAEALAVLSGGRA